MNFDITNGDIQKANELAAQISALTLAGARGLPTYRGNWRNNGMGGIKFRDKTVLEFGFGDTSLKRLLAVRSRTGWEHI